MSKKLSFESSMNRLDEIVQELEKNDLPLEETIKLFEEGLKLTKECDKQLKNFELKIEEIINE